MTEVFGVLAAVRRINAAPDKGVVEVWSRLEGDGVHVYVTDRAPEDPSDQRRVWWQFLSSRGISKTRAIRQAALSEWGLDR